MGKLRHGAASPSEGDGKGTHRIPPAASSGDNWEPPKNRAKRDAGNGGPCLGSNAVAGPIPSDPIGNQQLVAILN